MFKICRKALLPTIVTIILFVSGCGINETEVDQPAQAVIEVSFVELESGDPVVGVEVQVDALYEGETESVAQGSVLTRTEGEINGVITNPNEIVISQLFFTLEYNEEEHVFEEEVNLELRKEEPFDSVNFTFEVGSSPAEGDPE